MRSGTSKLSKFTGITEHLVNELYIKPKNGTNLGSPFAQKVFCEGIVKVAFVILPGQSEADAENFDFTLLVSVRNETHK